MKNLPKFTNQHLFEQAFTHRSYLNEVKEKLESNERLEFLGDSILSFVVSNYLFTTYKDFDEGTLTNLRSLLVNTKTLATVSKELEMGARLKLSRGEEESRGRENESLLANCFEAFIGALFLDQGIEAVKTFLADVLLPRTASLVERRVFKDPKSLLQENVQAKKLPSPLYKVLQEEGPAHAKVFTVGVYVGDTLMGKGQGRSKQQAEESAAQQAMQQQSEQALETGSK